MGTVQFDFNNLNYEGASLLPLVGEGGPCLGKGRMRALALSRASAAVTPSARIWRSDFDTRLLESFSPSASSKSA